MAQLIPNPLTALLREPGIVICGAIAIVVVGAWLLWPLFVGVMP